MLCKGLEMHIQWKYIKNPKMYLEFVFEFVCCVWVLNLQSWIFILETQYKELCIYVRKKVLPKSSVSLDIP